MSKTLQTRIQNKHDIEANWNLATNFKPLSGEMIVYDPDESHPNPRVKIGDGNTLVTDLPFIEQPEFIVTFTATEENGYNGYYGKIDRTFQEIKNAYIANDQVISCIVMIPEELLLEQTESFFRPKIIKLSYLDYSEIDGETFAFLSPSVGAIDIVQITNIGSTTLNIYGQINNTLKVGSTSYSLIADVDITDSINDVISNNDTLVKETDLEEVKEFSKEFVFTVSGDSENGYTSDAAYSEILEAYNAGRTVKCYYQGEMIYGYMPLLYLDDGVFTFVGTLGATVWWAIFVAPEGVTALEVLSDITINGQMWDGGGSVDFTDTINGMITEKVPTKLSDLENDLELGDGEYLPLSGGTVEGNLRVAGEANIDTIKTNELIIVSDAADATSSGPILGIDEESGSLAVNGERVLLASELEDYPLAGSARDITPTQVYEAMQAGRPIRISYSDATYGSLSFTGFMFALQDNLVKASSVIGKKNIELTGELEIDTWSLWITEFIENGAYLPLTGGTVTGETTFNKNVNLNGGGIIGTSLDFEDIYNSSNPNVSLYCGGGEFSIHDGKVPVWVGEPGKDWHAATKGYVDNAIPTMLPNPNSLTINGTSYDGSETVDIDTEVFYVTVRGSNLSEPSIDKTVGELEEAYQAGKTLRCLYADINTGGYEFCLDLIARYSETQFIFGGFSYNTTSSTIPFYTVYINGDSFTDKMRRLATDSAIPTALKNPKALTINGTSYDGSTAKSFDLAKKENGFFYVVGDSTETGVWTGTCSDITEYYDGLIVAYKPNIAGISGGTTLNINNLGAIPVIRNVSSAVTTHYGVDSIVILVYTTDDGTAYWKVADYDSDTKTRSSNKTGTKMYIIGASTQSTSGQTTYSNKNCYVGTDNCLYSNGEKVQSITEINALIDAKVGVIENGTY